jgi:hypothetical protein
MINIQKFGYSLTETHTHIYIYHDANPADMVHEICLVSFEQAQTNRKPFLGDKLRILTLSPAATWRAGRGNKSRGGQVASEAVLNLLFAYHQM